MRERTDAVPASPWLSAPRIVLGLLCVMAVLLYIDRVNIATAAPLIKADLKLSNTRLGLAFSVFAFPYAVFQIIGGWVGDRFGARLTLSLCCGVIGIATILTGAVTGFVSLLAVRLLLGIGEGTAFPAASRALTSWTSDEHRGVAQGLTHGSSRFGNAITPLLIASLLHRVSWRWSFVIVGAASFVWLWLWAWYFRDDPRSHRSVRAGDLSALPREKSAAISRAPLMALAKRMLPVTIVDFCYGWTLWLFLSWIPGFFYENYHQNLLASAIFSTGVLFLGFLGDITGGFLSDYLLRKTGNLLLARRSVVVGGLAGAFVFLIPVMLVHNLKVAAICLGLAAFSAELIVGPIWAIPLDITPQYAGTASGMMNFGFAVAGIVSPSSFGYLVDRTGSWVLPFIGSVVLLLLGAILASCLRLDGPLNMEVERPTVMASDTMV